MEKECKFGGVCTKCDCMGVACDYQPNKVVDKYEFIYNRIWFNNPYDFYDMIDIIDFKQLLTQSEVDAIYNTMIKWIKKLYATRETAVDKSIYKQYRGEIKQYEKVFVNKLGAYCIFVI